MFTMITTICINSITCGRVFFPCCHVVVVGGGGGGQCVPFHPSPGSSQVTQVRRQPCHGSLPSWSPSKMEAATPRSRAKVLHSREKEMLYKVNKFFLEEKACNGFLIPPSQATARTARATNVSEKTVQRICSKRGRTSPERAVFFFYRHNRGDALHLSRL